MRGLMRRWQTVVVVMCLACVAASADSDITTESGFAGFSAIDPESLEDMRAKEGGTVITVKSEQELNATVNGGTYNVDNLSTGGVGVAEGAFDGFNGVGGVILNSGNNNAFNVGIGISINLQ